MPPEKIVLYIPESDYNDDGEIWRTPPSLKGVNRKDLSVCRKHLSVREPVDPGDTTGDFDEKPGDVKPPPLG